jgi:hypothetical protein
MNISGASPIKVCKITGDNSKESISMLGEVMIPSECSSGGVTRVEKKLNKFGIQGLKRRHDDLPPHDPKSINNKSHSYQDHGIESRK